MATTGNQFASSAATAGSDVAWTSVNNALVDDNTIYSYAAITAQATQRLELKNFSGLAAAIPDGSTIDGIEVKWDKGITTGTVNDLLVQLIIEGVLSGDNKASATAWQTGGLRTDTYGGAADKWGLGSITRAQLIAATSGICLSATGTAGQCRVDVGYMIVYYTEGGTTETASGDGTNPVMTADGAGSISRQVTIAISNPPATAEATGVVSRFANGSPTNPAAQVETITVVNRKASGSSLNPVMTSNGSITSAVVKYATGQPTLASTICEGLVSHTPFVPVEPDVQANSGPSQLLKAFIQSQPSVSGKLRPYRFSNTVTKPSVFLERVPYNAKNPCIVVTPYGGTPQPGTRGSRAFTEYIEVKILFNTNSSSALLNRIGFELWNLIERHIEIVEGGKFWFSSERPELTQDNQALVCTLDIKANYMES